MLNSFMKLVPSAHAKENSNYCLRKEAHIVYTRKQKGTLHKSKSSETKGEGRDMVDFTFKCLMATARRSKRQKIQEIYC